MCARVLTYLLFILVQCALTQIYQNSELIKINVKEKLNSGRVVGGFETSIDYHPHQVSLRYNGRHLCGGAIIAEEWVITAAHCIKSMSSRGLSVKAGVSTLNGRGQVVNAKEVIVHEDYSRSDPDYDIALVELESNLEYNSRVQPIELASYADYYPSGSWATVTGWGVVESGGRLSNRLREASMPLMSNSECSGLYGKRRITQRMICAGKGGEDACQGDSGGPLVQDGKLIGIVSWGFGCAKPSYPGVYTRVTALRSWISEKTAL